MRNGDIPIRDLRRVVGRAILVSMATTYPTGAARAANRLILMATLGFSVCALVALALISLLVKPGEGPPLIVYGLSLFLCSACSFVYNVFDRSPRRRLYRLFDHAAIFLLIAGTYTPFTTIGIGGTFGRTLLSVTWTLAILGILLKFFANERHDRLFVFLYLAVGWIFVIGFNDMIASLNAWTLALLIAGGIAYTIGSMIYMRDIGRWTDPVWHGFVLAGSSLHFSAILILAS
jgi:hemolysin III